jgi:hypothetical protein
MVKVFKMNKEKIIEITQDVENKSNKDLFDVESELYEEFNKTRELILDLTNHLDSIETLYNKVNEELEKRTKK